MDNSSIAVRIDNNIRRIAIGTAQFGLPYGITNKFGQVPVIEASKILQVAHTAGINTIDTAVTYGSSESVLGKLDMSEWQITTKLPGLPEKCYNIEAWVTNTIQESLGRLKVRKLTGLLLHRPLQLLGSNGRTLYDAICKLKKEDLVEKIGFSIYSSDELDQLCQKFPPDLVQAPFNVFDQQLVNSGWLKQMHNAGIEIHVRSVFLQGLLLLQPQNLPKKFKTWRDLWNRWHKWLRENDVTSLQACLSFAMEQPEIDRIVVGVDNVSHLEEILTAAKSYVPPMPHLEFVSQDKNLINPSLWPNL